MPIQSLREKELHESSLLSFISYFLGLVKNWPCLQQAISYLNQFINLCELEICGGIPKPSEVLLWSHLGPEIESLVLLQMSLEDALLMPIRYSLQFTQQKFLFLVLTKPNSIVFDLFLQLFKLEPSYVLVEVWGAWRLNWWRDWCMIVDYGFVDLSWLGSKHLLRLVYLSFKEKQLLLGLR